jgi:hypothetical protein
MATEIIPLSTIDFTSQTYNAQDANLIPSFEIDTTLTSESYIEFFIYDNNKNLIIPNYNFTEYTVLNNGQSAGTNNSLSQIDIDPEKALIDYGFTQGEYTTYFNFLNKKIGSQIQQLYVTEISSDRKEIRLDSTVLTAYDIISTTSDFVTERANTPYFLDFYLNFGNNQLVIANNIQLDAQDSNNPTILVKLYEPLPEEIDINSTLWVVTAVEEPIAYHVIFEDIPVTFIDSQGIKGPNFNIDLKDQVNNSTQELSYLDLITTTLTSSQNQLSSLLEEKEIEINVDYTDFSNFIHFSSAQTRLENFYYKVVLIEEYTNAIDLLDNTTNSTLAISSSVATYESKINSIITNFDGYEYYLYYETGSSVWPKTNNQKPYTLAASDSPQVLTWFGTTNYASPYYGGLIVSASEFDNGNKDNLLYTIPEYLRDDPANDPYQLFVEMVGQHYDNIWVYYKDITNKYSADNRLGNGISNDIVADAIRDFGVKLYQNNFSNEDLYTAFLGLTPEGGLFPFPNITGSLPTPTGYEYVNTKISASSDYLPLDDVNKSLYKRIYHNIPYLLKAKGTLPGLRALITSYGIPDTILRINEYGGKDRINTNDWDFWQNEFNYSLSSPGTGASCIETSFDLNPQWGASDNTPEAVMLRFKLATLDPTTANQPETIFRLDSNITLDVVYTGSGFASGSYSGSIVNPYYQYATLTLYPNPGNLTVTASVYLPFYNQDWWSVMINAVPNGSNIDYTLYASNKIYEGGDNGTLLGFFQSSSCSSSKTPWIGSIQADYGTSMSGSLQEIRYYANPLSESVFKDYVMNPSSIKGNSLNSGPDELAFRASLGGELYTGLKSIHPKVTGSWAATRSFASDSNFTTQTPFEPNTEYFFYNQPVIGIKNAVNDKIRVENNVMPDGDVLSPFMSLSQQANISQSYTPNINYLEVAFSPQNEINEDIMDEMGYFNIGEYIGDPRLRSSSAESYPALDKLRNDYFQKYTKNYDLVDFIRLIKFFDNSLFKMIKDFVPARTSLASGVVVKQHLLERNKYPQPQVEWVNVTYTGSITTHQVWNSASQANEPSHSLIETFDGGTGGSFEPFNYLSNTAQSWTESINTPSGSVLVIHSSQDEFYNGELSGSVMTITTQSLAQAYPLENLAFNYTPVRYSETSYGFLNDLSDDPNPPFAENQFLNPLTVPSQGQMLLLTPWFQLGGITPGGGFLPNQRGPVYIKIHKFDNNGINNSTALGQLSNLLIEYSIGNYYKINVLTINEFPTYYLYLVSTLGSDSQDDYILNYKFSGSILTTQSLNTGAGQTLRYTSSIDLQNIYTSTSGLFAYNNTPNIPIIFTASFRAFTPSSTTIINLQFSGSGIPSTNRTVTTIPTTFTYTGSFYPISSSALSFFLYNIIGAPVTMSNFQILFTQSIDPSPAEQASVIIEPYITTPNYYNSDYNPLINNITIDRLNYKYQDVDYSTGITVPQNFRLLISGSALKAAVQDSNYTTKRHIIPRYEGSKSTSQHLNYWTPGDVGTYGKTPTAESLKTVVAYCDWIGGWPPERMNSSGAHVLYLINADGTVSIPNTSQNSLENIQGAFQTGEQLKISAQGGTPIQSTPYRTIIRGGTTIKPILYTQIGHTPAGWTSSLNLINSNVQTTITNITTLSNIYPHPTDSPVAQYITNTAETLGDTSNSGDSITDGWSVYYDASNYRQGTGDYYYLVPSIATTQGINVIVDANIQIRNASYNDVIIQVKLNRLRGSTVTAMNTQNITFVAQEEKGIPFYVSLAPQIDILTNDRLYFTVQNLTTIPPGYGTVQVVYEGTYFNTPQNPLPNPLPSASVATGSVWNYPTSSTYNQASSSNAGIIFIPLTSSVLNVYYDVAGVRQQDISASGFNTIDTDWSVKIGDEFRFEGREDRVFMVKKVFPPTTFASERISRTGSLEVHLDKSIPSASINLDHFVIRRYADDASIITFEGFKPANSEGPFIVSPQYVVPELDKNIDTFITDLTQKGLL